MKKVTSRAPAGLSSELLAQLQAAARLPDDQIDTSDPDAPEALDWTGAVRGKYYKPRKVQKTVRLDADVLAYYEAQGPGYQTRINRDLRASMLRDLRHRHQSTKEKKREGMNS